MAIDYVEARLLVVDDERNIRLPLVLALKSQGYFVKDVGSGREALALLTQIPFDLMVLDMQLPDSNGVEIMTEARQLQPQMLIIILTGYPTLDNAIASIRSEVADYLTKPVGVKEITGTVTQALQKHNFLDSLLHWEYWPPNQVALSNQSTQAIQLRYIRIYPITLDCLRQIITIEDNSQQPVELTEGETIILASLMKYPDRVFSCSELVKIAWGNTIEESNAQSIVRPYISRLRCKLESFIKSPGLIRTVRKRGYYFAALEATPSAKTNHKKVFEA